MEKRVTGRRKPHRTARRTTSSGSSFAVRLIICGVIFVAVVFFKLLFPQNAARMTAAVGNFLGRDADFQGAVAAMGRAVSGESGVGDALQDACTAVFAPGEEKENAVEVLLPEQLEIPVKEEKSAEKVPADVPQEGSADLQVENDPAAPQMTEDLPPAGDEGVTDEPQNDSDTAEMKLSKVYTMPPMPENASLEQRNLGFAHQSPVVGKLTSPFGWREHPVEGGTKFHYGVDLSGSIGTPICAFADGEVYATGESSTLGKYVMLRHEGEYMTLYAHMSKVCVSGGKITMGEKIGEVGDTGRTTGPHLHFELHDDSLYLNPIYYVDLE